MRGQLRVGDEGSTLRISVTEEGYAFNASAVTTKTLKLRPPSGTVVEKTATFESNGADGIFLYTFVNGDLTESGPWQGQLLLVAPAGRWHTEPFTFSVGENLS